MTEDQHEDVSDTRSVRARNCDDISNAEASGVVPDSHLLRALAWLMLAVSAASATGILLFNQGLDEDVELSVVGGVYLLLVISWISIRYRTHEEAHVASALSALALTGLFTYLVVQWLTPLPQDVTPGIHDPFANASCSPGRIRGSLIILASTTTAPLAMASIIMTIGSYRWRRPKKDGS